MLRMVVGVRSLSELLLGQFSWHVADSHLAYCGSTFGIVCVEKSLMETMV
jgi:hypothetical protein